MLAIMRAAWVHGIEAGEGVLHCGELEGMDGEGGVGGVGCWVGKLCRILGGEGVALGDIGKSFMG